MGRDILDIDTSFARRFLPERLDLHDLEAVRLVLSGTSVIDWHKLDLDTLDKVDAYLRISLIDPDDPTDMERLRFVFHQAINYLEEHQAADLKHRLAISEAELFDRAEQAIIKHADAMRREGYPLLAFYGSRKTRTSVISKLLSKRESIAATIFDKLRFRIVVRHPEEVLPALAHLTKTLFPVNYVIPGESHNNLVDLRALAKSNNHVRELSKKLQRLKAKDHEREPANPLSGSGYRIVNWIIDFPVRVDDVLPDTHAAAPYMLGRIVYVMVEFQVLDRQTEKLNDQGENSHDHYKDRQRKEVEGRLLKGSLRRR